MAPSGGTFLLQLIFFHLRLTPAGASVSGPFIFRVYFTDRAVANRIGKVSLDLGSRTGADLSSFSESSTEACRSSILVEEMPAFLVGLIVEDVK